MTTQKTIQTTHIIDAHAHMLSWIEKNHIFDASKSVAHDLILEELMRFIDENFNMRLHAMCQQNKLKN